MHRVCIIGSGNWGTTIAKLIGENIKNEKMKSEFDQTIRFYVGKEMVNEKPLSDIINNSHEDVKYMQGVILPDNVKAYNDIEKAAEGEDKLLTAKNKWLIGHEEAAIEGAFNGLKGENVGID